MYPLRRTLDDASSAKSDGAQNTGPHGRGSKGSATGKADGFQGVLLGGSDSGTGSGPSPLTGLF